MGAVMRAVRIGGLCERAAAGTGQQTVYGD